MEPAKNFVENGNDENISAGNRMNRPSTIHATSAYEAVSMRFFSHTSQDGKQDKPRGSTDKNVGRVQPAEQSGAQRARSVG